MARNHSRQYFDAVEDIPGSHRLGNRPAGGDCIVLPKAIDNFIYTKYWVQKLLLDRANGLWQDMLVCQPPFYLVCDASSPYHSLKGITMGELQTCA